METKQKFKINRTQQLLIDQEGRRAIQISQSVELTRAAIEAGFLKELPGTELSLYLYLLTHVGQDFSLTTNPTVIASLLPCTPKEIERGLKMLENKEYISIEENGQPGEEVTIALDRLPASLATEPLEEEVPVEVSELPQETENEPDVQVTEQTVPKVTSNIAPEASELDEQPAQPQENEVITYLLKQKVFSEQDLVRAITSMIPAQNINHNFRQEVDYWFNTFEKEVIKELIRRTDEARLQKDLDFNSQAYMRKIANEWIAEQIFTLADLQESDKLYRETRTLIEEFGIDRLNDVTRTHWRTIHGWINAESAGDFALNTEVAKYAIQQAILRSSSGRPSLTYIENNYIKPFKENKIKNIKEAEALIDRRSDNYSSPSGSASKQKKTTNKANTQENKWQLGVDFTRFREN